MDRSDPGLSALIITLDAEPSLRATAVRALRSRRELEVGEPDGCWVPAVLEADHPDDVCRELERIPGVVLVEVVFVEVATPAA